MIAMVPVICLQCGIEFQVKRCRLGKARFCSRRCRGLNEASNPQERFWPRVQKTDTCWLWTGAADHFGYGRFGHNGRVVLTHRFSYESVRGPVPAGTELDHLCRNPRCVNPAHLEPVSHRENVVRGARANKETCRNGHPMTPENITAWSARNGHKTCKLCVADRVRRQREQINAGQRARRARKTTEAA